MTLAEFAGTSSTKEPSSTDLFRLLIDNLPELAWTAKPDGHIDFYNRRWYEYTGTTFEEMQGWGWEKIHAPDMLPRVVERWQESLRTGEPFEMEFPLRRHDGEMRWFLTRIRPLRGSDGQIHRWFGTNTDVDDQRRAALRVDEARREAEHAQRLSDTLATLGLVFASERDPERIVQRVTDEATALVGAQFGSYFHNVADSEGHYGLYVLSGAPRQAFEGLPHVRATPLFKPTFEGQTVRLDDVRDSPLHGHNPPHHGFPDRHLPVRSYLAVAVRGQSGDVLGALLFGHAEVGRFSAEHQRIVEGLASHAAVALDNASLLAEVRASALRAEQAKARAEQLVAALSKSNAALDQFAYITSHDLKAPLRGIASLVQWIAEDTNNHLTSESREFFDRILGRVNRLDGLIAGILDYSRAGRTRARPEPIEMHKLLAESIELLAPPAGARVSVSPGLPSVEAERVPLQQVFMNLIGNALKYADRPDPEVKVEGRTEEDMAHFTVTDNGPGIAPEHHERIWGIFQTLAPRDRVESTGIGLSVVKKIVESRGGKTWVESSEGRGATFHVLWPLRPRSDPAEGPPPAGG